MNIWGHKEWAPTRKVDPIYNMDQMRLRIDQHADNPPEDGMSQADIDAINAHTDAQVTALQTEILRQLAANLGASAVSNGNSWLNAGIAARLGANERANLAPLMDDEANIIAAAGATEKHLTDAIGRVVSAAGPPADPTDPEFVRAVAAELGAAVGRGTTDGAA